MRRIADELAVVAALAKQVLRVRFLKVIAPDLAARDLRRDCYHRHARAMAIEEPVDQVQIAWPTTAGANRERAGQVRLRACRKGGRLLVPCVDPVDRSFRSQCVCDAVE